MSSSRLRPFKPGTRIGSVTILSAVDTSTCDPVFIVWHHDAWCPMACKFFASERRARREAEALSALTHPNIVRFFGYGEPAHVLMEFLEGPTLSRLLETQPSRRLPLADALRVATHIGAALAHVHANGLLHLDVKPSNVIVPHGRPVLFDFGSMRRQGAARPPECAGTDAYMAPEECLLGKATAAADVFSLGVTLYELLTGELPFREGTRANPHPQVNDEPVPLRRRRPDVSSRVEAAVMSCLARDPHRRPGIAVLLPELDGLVAGGLGMWPAGFAPAPAPEPKRASGGLRKVAPLQEIYV